MKFIKRIGLFGLFSVVFTLGLFSVRVDAAPLYVQSSEKVPKEATVLATQHWEEYLSNMIYSENGRITDYYLGQPFTISYPQDIKYNFPIINKLDRSIEYMLQMDQKDYSNAETYILSKALATKLEELSKTIVTNTNKSICIIGSNQSVSYEYDGAVRPLLSVDDEAPLNVESIDSGITAYDITEKITEAKNRIIKSSIEFDNNVLPWTVYETQEDKPWCQYYTYAAIINNQAGKEITSAKQIIDGSYPQATDEQKDDIDWVMSGNLYDSIKYVNRTFDKDIKFENNALSFERIKSEIDSKRPIVTNLKSDDAAGHAIVLMGYTAAKGNPSYKPFYHYWNPWWEDTFVVSSNSPYMNLGPYKYTWNRTLFNFQEMKPTVSYSSFVENKRWLPVVENGKLSGTTGQGLRMEAIKIDISGLANGVSGGIAYSTHVQDIGWQPEVANGQMAGTNGQKLRMEAIKIRLTDDLSKKYSVQYRTHVQSIGWTAYSKDNQVSGTSGKKLRIEAIEIKLVKK